MGGATFDTPKPIELLERMLKMITFSSDDCIVMDFFSGSATLAHAVMNINREYGGQRKFILVQLPEILDSKAAARELGYDNLCQIGEERIKRAGDLIVSEINESNKQLALGELPITIPDVGFRVLKLDSSGILCPEPGRLLLERVKPDRTDQDIIFEMMLKWGLELTYPIEKMEINGYECYSIAGDALICCMKPGLTVQTLNEIAELEPDRVLMLDSILDDTLKLNALQIFKRVEERTQKKIDLRTV